VAKTIGHANTVGELKKILEQVIEKHGEDFPVRVPTMSHTWAPDVEEHQLCILLTP
jgi:hypothetical protein